MDDLDIYTQISTSIHALHCAIDKGIESFMALVSFKPVLNMGLLIILLYLLSVAVYSEAGDYVRPPSRPIVPSPSTTTTAMDPEQVQNLLFFV